jgi:hypothetical protein
MTNATTANVSEERYWVMLVLAFGLGVATTLLAVSCLVWFRRTNNGWWSMDADQDVPHKLCETARSGSASTTTLVMDVSSDRLGGGTVKDVTSRLLSRRGMMRSSGGGPLPPQTTSLLSQAALASAVLHAHHFAHNDIDDEQDGMSECAPSSISSHNDYYQEMHHPSQIVEFALLDGLLDPAIPSGQAEPVWTAPKPVPRWRLFGSETTATVTEEQPTADTQTVAVSNCQSLLVGSAPILSHHSHSSSRSMRDDDECRAYHDNVYSRSAECRLALHVV